VWFAIASILTTILHELAHAIAALALGVRSTLFNYYVDLDRTVTQTAGNVPALIGVSGPVFCLAFGLLSWLALRPARGSAAELPLLYLAAFGVATFFGNMMSMAFVGDFSRVSAILHLPMIVRYVGTGIGALGTAAVQFWLGRQLVRWVPADASTIAGVLGIVVLPVVLGTAAVIVVNQPMPRAFMSARISEAVFSVFAVIGALVVLRNPPGDRASLQLSWVDGVVAALAVAMVRILVRGIPFEP
jgi:hypothetical protein